MTCAVCGEPIDRKRGPKGGRYATKYCSKRCHKKSDQLRHPDRYRDAHYRRMFGITLADYEAMLTGQGGCCAICRKADPGSSRVKNFTVDHCHQTGRIRGLLCHRCNAAIALLDDSSDSAAQASVYLR